MCILQIVRVLLRFRWSSGQSPQGANRPGMVFFLNRDPCLDPGRIILRKLSMCFPSGGLYKRGYILGCMRMLPHAEKVSCQRKYTVPCTLLTLLLVCCLRRRNECSSSTGATLASRGILVARGSFSLTQKSNGSTHGKRGESEGRCSELPYNSPRAC